MELKERNRYTIKLYHCTGTRLLHPDEGDHVQELELPMVNGGHRRKCINVYLIFKRSYLVLLRVMTVLIIIQPNVLC